jgi:hypothetical protein
MTKKLTPTKTKISSTFIKHGGYGTHTKRGDGRRCADVQSSKSTLAMQ